MADCVNRRPRRGCRIDPLGRSVCAEMIRQTFATFGSLVTVTDVAPPEGTFGVCRYPCPHGVTYWVEPAFTMRGEEPP